MKNEKIDNYILFIFFFQIFREIDIYQRKFNFTKFFKNDFLPHVPYLNQMKLHKKDNYNGSNESIYNVFLKNFLSKNVSDTNGKHRLLLLEEYIFPGLAFLVFLKCIKVVKV